MSFATPRSPHTLGKLICRRVRTAGLVVVALAVPAVGSGSEVTSDAHRPPSSPIATYSHADALLLGPTFSSMGCVFETAKPASWAVQDCELAEALGATGGCVLCGLGLFGGLFAKIAVKAAEKALNVIFCASCAVGILQEIENWLNGKESNVMACLDALIEKF